MHYRRTGLIELDDVLETNNCSGVCILLISSSNSRTVWCIVCALWKALVKCYKSLQFVSDKGIVKYNDEAPNRQRLKSATDNPLFDVSQRNALELSAICTALGWSVYGLTNSRKYTRHMQSHPSNLELSLAISYTELRC